MPTINISFEVDQELMDALQATVSERNARQSEESTPWTVETHLADQNKTYAADRAAHYYNVSLQRLGEGFKSKDYPTRQAVIASLEAQL